MSTDALADFDTAAELFHRFVGEWIRFSETYASLSRRKPTSQLRIAGCYVSRISAFVVAFAFIRSALATGITAWFWTVTDWPSGGLAVISVALFCAFTSTSPNAPKMALQIAIGAVFATMTGYLFTCHVYPNIDGFPLLCTPLAPVLALGAFIATRKQAVGYGIGFFRIFLSTAGPDNIVIYMPDLLINNGIALTASMLLASLAVAVVQATRLMRTATWVAQSLLETKRSTWIRAGSTTCSGFSVVCISSGLLCSAVNRKQKAH